MCHNQSSLLKLTAIPAIAVALVVLLSPLAIAHTAVSPSAERLHIKRRVEEQVGAPYSYGGTSPRGFDCSGFTRWVYAKHGSNLPHSSLAQFRLARRGGHKRIHNRNNLHVGDLVFHKTSSAKVGHAGIYIGKGKFVSATSSDGVRVNSVRDPYYWGRRWVGATRLPVTRS